MKTVRCLAFLLSTANPSRTGGYQGNELIVMSAEASALSAVVKDPAGAPLAGVAVVRFPCPKGEFRGKTEPREIGSWSPATMDDSASTGIAPGRRVFSSACRVLICSK